MNCKNFDELEKALGGYGITMTNKVKQLHFATVYEVVKGITMTIDMFPQLKGYVTKLDVWHNNNWLVSAAYDGIIYFSLNRFNKIMPIKLKKINKCINGRWHHPVNMGFAGLGAHECGHLLVKAWIDKNYPDRLKNFKQQVWNNSSAAKSILSKIEKDNKVKIYNLKKQMCSYANINDSECIAECICDFVTNGYKACELSQLVVKFFREEL